MNPAVQEIPTCPDHRVRLEQRRSRFGHFWVCPALRCEWRVGAHRDTGRPLGTPANNAMRAARHAAHAAFDPLWTYHRTGKVRHRLRAYAWLARQLGIPVEECHIARFDVALCKRVVEVCEQYGPSYRKGIR